MTEYYHQHAEDYGVYWDILDTLICSGKLTTHSSPKEIKEAIEHEARKRGLSEDETDTAITYAFDNISALG